MRLTAVQVGRLRRVSGRPQAVGGVRHAGARSRHGVKQRDSGHDTVHYAMMLTKDGDTRKRVRGGRLRAGAKANRAA